MVKHVYSFLCKDAPESSQLRLIKAGRMTYRICYSDLEFYKRYAMSIIQFYRKYCDDCQLNNVSHTLVNKRKQSKFLTKNVI